MTETIISLNPSMKKRLDFDHPLMDTIPAGKAGKMGGIETIARLKSYRATGSMEDRDALLMGNLWMVKDLVCRFRAHWPETLHMTDDLVSEGLVAITEFISERCEGLDTQKQFYGKAQQFIHSRLRDYINNTRSSFAASVKTNRRRQKDDKPLEYNYATEHNDELNGVQDFDPCYVDVLDSIEALADCDREEMQEMILMFLQHDHNIAEADLSDDERAALDKLSKMGEDLL